MEDWLDNEGPMEGAVWTLTARLMELDSNHELLVYCDLLLTDEDWEPLREEGIKVEGRNKERILLAEAMKDRFYGAEFGDWRVVDPLLVWQTILANYILALEAAILAIDGRQAEEAVP